MKTPNLLDCTLRDGSYSIQFQFTAAETADISLALESTGIRWIEIGHGLGLHASESTGQMAACTDEEYMQAASAVLQKAGWGMFCIPGIARIDDLNRASDFGMGFVRIGTNATEIEQAEPFVQRAKNLGLTVASNCMKSYVLSPDQLANQAAKAESHGADVFYIVDSAGNMLPSEVKDYISAIRSKTSIPIGLHCHDNLTLGIANCMAAMEENIDWLDSTIQGIGRGGGNPSTEILVSVMKRMGIENEFNLNALLDLGTELIQPLLQKPGFDPINITSGYAGFHSSFLNVILQTADQYDVDPRDLIVEACSHDRISVEKDNLIDIAKTLSATRPRKYIHRTVLKNFIIDSPSIDYQQSDVIASVKTLAKQIHSIATKKGKQSVLNIVIAMKPDVQYVVSRFIQEFDSVIGSIQCSDLKCMLEMGRVIDGKIDIILVDRDQKTFITNNAFETLSSTVTQSRVLGYNDTDVLARSMFQEIQYLCQSQGSTHIVVAGTSPLAREIIFKLLSCGFSVAVTSFEHDKLHAMCQAIRALSIPSSKLSVHESPGDAVADSSVLVLVDPELLNHDPSCIAHMPNASTIIDGMITGIPQAAHDHCEAKKIQVLRPDMRSALSSELHSLLGVERIITSMRGRVQRNNRFLVAGGLVGKKGDIVVDSISNPATVIGVADGQGKVDYPDRETTIQILKDIEPND